MALYHGPLATLAADSGSGGGGGASVYGLHLPSHFEELYLLVLALAMLH